MPAADSIVVSNLTLGEAADAAATAISAELATLTVPTASTFTTFAAERVVIFCSLQFSFHCV